MSRIVAVLSLLISVAASAETIQVLDISPASGPSAGGTTVSIRLSSLPDCPILPIGPPAVSFDGVWRSSTLVGPDTLLVAAPPHAPGQVDLTITACGMDDLVVPKGFSYFTQTTANPSFHVLSVTPAHGPTTGGTEVTAQLDGIPFCFDPVPGARMTFGGIDATNVHENLEANTVTGVSPAHSQGAVDMVVGTCGGPSVALQSGFTYDQGPDPDSAYEKVLFPVFSFGAGANGSQWATKITVYNSGDGVMTTANALFRDRSLADPCVSACGCAGPQREIQPYRTEEICDAFSDPAGLLFYAPKVAAAELHYSARVFDTARSTLNAGTEIRTVREREFRSDQIVLQDLPLDQHLRLNLRVYDPDQHDGAQVKMQILEVDGVGQYGERVLTLTHPGEWAIPAIPLETDSPWPSRPAFAYVGDLAAIVRQMLGTDAGSVRSFHVRLTPITPGIRIWGMATLTNNETQLITTVTPQY